MSNKFRRLFYDIETSPMLVTAFRTGKQFISYKNVVKDIKIICVCWKWEGEKKVHSLEWDENQDDEKLLREFSNVMNEADELVAHNGDFFDMNVLRTRCMMYRIPMPPYHKTVDTYKWAKRFHLPSKGLDSIHKKFLNGGKMETGGMELWTDILLNKSDKSLKKMVRYCKKDVQVLEDVYYLLAPYSHHKSHVGVSLEGDKLTCPHCASKKFYISKTRTTPSGIKKRQMQCKNNSCRRYFTISDTLYSKFILEGNGE